MPSLKPITEPEMEATHYGIPVAYIGEDGDLIALGHHSTRRALAAFNRHARTFLGFDNIADDRSTKAADLESAVSQKFAVFRKPDPNDCGEDPNWAWVADWSDPETPGAQPVTRLHF